MPCCILHFVTSVLESLYVSIVKAAVQEAQSRCDLLKSPRPSPAVQAFRPINQFSFHWKGSALALFSILVNVNAVQALQWCLHCLISKWWIWWPWAETSPNTLFCLHTFSKFRTQTHGNVFWQSSVCCSHGPHWSGLCAHELHSQSNVQQLS